MKVTFKVTDRNGNINNLIKEVNSIHCQIKIDFEHGIVIATGNNNTEIDTVIELIGKYFKVEVIQINNEVTNKTISPTEQLNCKKFELKSEEDAIIDRITAENANIARTIKKSLKNIYWAMITMQASNKEIESFINNQIKEISMRYNKKPSIEFSIGDVVDCYTGMTLETEKNGREVDKVIICNILKNGMAYVVPIVNGEQKRIVHSYITVLQFEIMYYYKKNSSDNRNEIVWLDRGMYVRPERFYEVIGKASQGLFKKVLEKLATETFNFMDENTKK